MDSKLVLVMPRAPQKDARVDSPPTCTSRGEGACAPEPSITPCALQAAQQAKQERNSARGCSIHGSWMGLEQPWDGERLHHDKPLAHPGQQQARRLSWQRRAHSQLLSSSRGRAQRWGEAVAPTVGYCCIGSLMYSILVVSGVTARWEGSHQERHGVGVAAGAVGREGRWQEAAPGMLRRAPVRRPPPPLWLFASPRVLSTGCIQQQNGAHPLCPS